MLRRVHETEPKNIGGERPGCPAGGSPALRSMKYHGKTALVTVLVFVTWRSIFLGRKHQLAVRYWHSVLAKERDQWFSQEIGTSSTSKKFSLR